MFLRVRLILKQDLARCSGRGLHFRTAVHSHDCSNVVAFKPVTLA
jgi:hypothetical protein